MIPAIEIILGDYLRTYADVMALGARVATKTPRTHKDPWVRITLLDPQDIGSQEHAFDFLVQLDCFAGDTAIESHDGQMEALTLARTVRAALKAAQGQTIGGTVVARVKFTGMTSVPDTTSEPARDRYVLTASVVAH